MKNIVQITRPSIRHRRYSLGLVIVAAAAWWPAQAEGDTTKVEKRLATEFIRNAMTSAAMDPPTTAYLEIATILSQEAMKLDPENPEMSRLVMELAMLADRNDLRDQALERLVRLDPADDVLRLRRLNTAIDRFQTAPERLDAYEKLLSPRNLEQLGPAVASRLALDQALLLRRQGNTDQFVKALGRAVELDSSNRAAAAMAAGFFRMNVNDPFAEAELLINLMMADPTDATTQVALAQLMLENGAYAAAEHLYTMAAKAMVVARQFPTNELIADKAISQWAKGDDDAALETIRVRQAELDQGLRDLYREQNPDLAFSDIALAQQKARTEPTMATIAAAIRSVRKDDQAGAAAVEVVVAYQQRLDFMQRDDQTKTPAEIAAQTLEMASVALWFNADLTQVAAKLSTPEKPRSVVSVADMIAAADKLEPLSQVARDRFSGWLAYRSGDLSKAVELLEPIADQDIGANIGLAMIFQETGRNRDAATRYLAVARAKPGSVIGIWAARKLSELVGRRTSLSPVADKLEGLIASVPGGFFRYIDDPSMAISLRIAPNKPTYDAFEPIDVTIEVINNSVLPLAIDRNGPIRSQIVLVPTLRSATAANLDQLPPFVVDIGRRLRLQPREKVTVVIDVRDYAVGDLLNGLASSGAMLGLKAQLNFVATPQGMLEPGILGTEVEAPVVWIDGERTDDKWVEDTVAAIQRQPGPGDVDRLAMLSFVIAPQLAADAPQETARRILDARDAFNEAFGKLDGPSQAWLLSVMPNAHGAASDGIQSTLNMVRKSEHRLVQMIYLLRYTSGYSDPMLDAARRGNDPALARLATIIQNDARKAAGLPAGQ